MLLSFVILKNWRNISCSPLTLHWMSIITNSWLLSLLFFKLTLQIYISILKKNWKKEITPQNIFFYIFFLKKANYIEIFFIINFKSVMYMINRADNLKDKHKKNLTIFGRIFFVWIFVLDLLINVHKEWINS